MNETTSPRGGRSTIIVVALIAAVIAIPFMLQPRHSRDASATLGDKSTTGKIVMLDFYTDWCGYCTKMDKEVYPNADVQKAMQAFEFRKINAEEGEQNKALAAKYNIEGFPTVVFVDSKGTEVHRIVGYQPADQFARSLTEAVSKAGGS